MPSTLDKKLLIAGIVILTWIISFSLVVAINCEVGWCPPNCTPKYYHTCSGNTYIEYKIYHKSGTAYGCEYEKVEEVYCPSYYKSYCDGNTYVYYTNARCVKGVGCEADVHDKTCSGTVQECCEVKCTSSGCKLKPVNSKCLSGETCNSQSCLCEKTGCKKKGEKCSSDSDCCKGLECKNGVCEERISCGFPGDTCSSDSDCCSGLLCENGKCTEEIKIHCCKYQDGGECCSSCCIASAKCGDSNIAYFKCDLSKGIWKSTKYKDSSCSVPCGSSTPPTSCKSEGELCTKDSDCCSGLKCKNGVCKPKSTSCTSYKWSDLNNCCECCHYAGGTLVCDRCVSASHCKKNKCSCSSWQFDGCGVLGCLPGYASYSRTCTPSGCKPTHMCSSGISDDCKLTIIINATKTQNTQEPTYEAINYQLLKIEAGTQSGAWVTSPVTFEITGESMFVKPEHSDCSFNVSSDGKVATGNCTYLLAKIGTTRITATAPGYISASATLIVSKGFVTLTANPTQVPADSVSSSEITAELNPKPSTALKTIVFKTNLGTLYNSTASGSSVICLVGSQGKCNVYITSSKLGLANITAESEGYQPSFVTVNFTEIPSNYVSVFVHPKMASPGSNLTVTVYWHSPKYHMGDDFSLILQIDGKNWTSCPFFKEHFSEIKKHMHCNGTHWKGHYKGHLVSVESKEKEGKITFVCRIPTNIGLGHHSLSAIVSIFPQGEKTTPSSQKSKPKPTPMTGKFVLVNSTVHPIVMSGETTFYVKGIELTGGNRQAGGLFGIFKFILSFFHLGNKL